ncbi:hypothetical protein OH491_04295 [Termitidicoccus mucosus]|uniref:hypothetical protein n=1 Tax=Termitidicoccus mucosus TaxID=1184151 RepID=UPI002FEE5ED2
MPARLGAGILMTLPDKSPHVSAELTKISAKLIIWGCDDRRLAGAAQPEAGLVMDQAGMEGHRLMAQSSEQSEQLHADVSPPV